MTTKISTVSKIILLVSAVAMVISIFVPIWQIDLDAPQYPEGLMLEIWANRLAGDVDIINGLNHYIGMKTLHTEDFIEFKILPYIISAYALLFTFAAINGSKKWLNISFIMFILFGILAMADFWKWEYDYGHNLDPDAAIKVPGMAYQPPLIGFKQLLNFGAYSIPSIGGWLFVASGILLFIAMAKENGLLKALPFYKRTAMIFITAFFLFACSNSGPQLIQLNTDGCDFCRMTISDGRFAAEVITQKGRVYKFDDIGCMLKYRNEQSDIVFKNYYTNEYLKDNVLIDATTAWYIYHDGFKSPMGSNIAAFSSQKEAHEYAAGVNTSVQKWSELSDNGIQHHHHESDHDSGY